MRRGVNEMMNRIGKKRKEEEMRVVRNDIG